MGLGKDATAVELRVILDIVILHGWYVGFGLFVLCNHCNSGVSAEERHTLAADFSITYSRMLNLMLERSPHERLQRVASY